ncbi:MAG: Gfo/Idh/MocA family oxidoreductase [Lentisphaerae bacterium]|nr:Gfo/Idh/MocA family oxidoreductase [Lentisphaerota bacterium]
MPRDTELKTDLAGPRGPRPGMFDYLEDEDIDARYGGGAPRPETPHFHFAVVGAGVAGQGNMLGLIREGRGAVRGLYDTRRRSIDTALRCLEHPENVRVYDSPDALFADGSVDAVVIASPNHTHREMLERAVRAGKHVLLQKPMATTIEDARAMVRAVKDYPRVVMLFLEYRLKPVYLQAYHEAFVRKSLGDIKMLRIHEHRGPFLNKAGQWNKFSRYSGGTLVEKCCHYFDLFNVFARSRPRRVFASGRAAVHYKDFVYKGERSDILDSAYVIVEYENGIRACLDFCMFAFENAEGICLNGDRGRFQGDDGESARIRIRADNGVPDAELVTRWRQGGAHSGSSPKQLKLFADAVDGTAGRYPTVEEGFWSVVLGVAAERSVASGQPVDIPELLEACGGPPEGSAGA